MTLVRGEREVKQESVKLFYCLGHVVVMMMCISTRGVLVLSFVTLTKTVIQENFVIRIYFVRESVYPISRPVLKIVIAV